MERLNIQCCQDFCYLMTFALFFKMQVIFITKATVIFSAVMPVCTIWLLVAAFQNKKPGHLVPWLVLEGLQLTIFNVYNSVIAIFFITGTIPEEVTTQAISFWFYYFIFSGTFLIQLLHNVAHISLIQIIIELFMYCRS